MSFQLYRTNASMGALNVHATEPGLFDEQAIATGSVFAAHAALSLHAQVRDDQFREALASRDIIGQSKGMLMLQHDIDVEKAFDMLRQISQDTNVRLVELARRLIAIERPPAEGS